MTKQQPQQDFLPPVSQHIAENIVHYQDGYMMFAIKLDGIPFEGVNDSHLIAANETLKNLFATVGKQFGNRLALWTHIQRQEIKLKRDYDFGTAFSRDFAADYISQFNQKYKIRLKQNLCLLM